MRPVKTFIYCGLLILLLAGVCTSVRADVLQSWVKIGGEWYYRDENGELRTGWLYDNDNWYYLESSGVMATGWKKIRGKWYYFKPTGAMVTGWLKRGGKTYYMQPSGSMKTGWLQLDGAWYYFTSSGAMHTGWLEKGGSTYYMDDSTGEMVTYWYNADGTWSFFGTDGKYQYSRSGSRLYSGKGVVTVDNSPLRRDYEDYTNPSGVITYYSAGTVIDILGIVTDSGNDDWYVTSYNGETGYIYSGRVALQYEGSLSEADFEKQLKAFPDYYRPFLREAHSRYPNFSFSADYIDMTLEEALDGQMEYGWKTIDGATAGRSLVKTYMDPYTYLTGNDFFMFAEQYYDPDVQNFISLQDELSYGNSFMNNNDYMKGLMDSAEIYGVSPYVLAATITLEKGWSVSDSLDVSGREVYSGYIKKDTTPVCSSPNGNWRGVLNANDRVFIVRGYDETDQNGKKWYMIIYNGYPGYVAAEKVKSVAYYNTYYNLFSINQTDNNVVCGGLSRAMEEGWDTPGKSLRGGARFCAEGYLSNRQDTYYYIHFNVLNPVNELWHEYSTGVTAGLKCARILALAYRINNNERLNFRIPVYIHRGWIERDGNKYYYNDNEVMQTGWKLIDDSWYYFNSDGTMATGWQKIGSKWYYLNEDGTMAVGWKKLDGKWYYLNEDGDMATGWKEINGKWYYFNPGGSMVTGWKNINSYRYYFNSGGDMAIGWKKIDSKWYYFNSKGRMVTGTQVIDGKTYTFGDDGVWIP